MAPLALAMVWIPNDWNSRDETESSKILQVLQVSKLIQIVYLRIYLLVTFGHKCWESRKKSNTQQ